MKKPYVLSGILITAGMLTHLAELHAATFIDVGNHLLLPNTPNQVVEIYVTGDADPIQGFNINAQIGNDPQTEVTPVFAYGGGPGTSTIIGLGTIFNFDNTGMAEYTYFPSLFQASTTTALPTSYVFADGLLATLIVDTTGFSTGTWPLILSETIGGFFTDWAGSQFPPALGGGPVPNPVITDGSITIVPEPSSIALAVIGMAFLGILAIRRTVGNRPPQAEAESAAAVITWLC